MKVLWVKRSVPDNYVGPDFLSELKHNQNVVKYPKSTVVTDASVLLVNVVLAVIFVLSFVTIYRYQVDPRYFVLFATSYDLIFVYKWILIRPEESRRVAFKSAIVTAVSVMVLTPVIRSLTESTSSDSIWAMCGWLLVLNVLVSSRSSPVLSTTTALAATIVLSSRLQNSLDVFYFVLFNIESFVTLPHTFKWLRGSENSDRWVGGLVMTMSMCSCALVLWILGWLILFLWIMLQALLLYGIPALFLSLQKYKDRISGPWDRAQPILD